MLSYYTTTAHTKSAAAMMLFSMSRLRQTPRRRRTKNWGPTTATASCIVHVRCLPWQCDHTKQLSLRLQRTPQKPSRSMETSHCKNNSEVLDGRLSYLSLGRSDFTFLWKVTWGGGIIMTFRVPGSSRNNVQHKIQAGKTWPKESSARRPHFQGSRKWKNNRFPVFSRYENIGNIQFPNSSRTRKNSFSLSMNVI